MRKVELPWVRGGWRGSAKLRIDENPERGSPPSQLTVQFACEEGFLLRAFSENIARFQMLEE